MKTKKKRAGPKAKKAAPKDYLVEYADGRQVEMTKAQFERLHRAGKIKKGTAVYYPEGWFVVGVAPDEVFSE